jgi:hypothetical protein
MKDGKIKERFPVFHTVVGWATTFAAITTHIYLDAIIKAEINFKQTP